MLAIGGTAFAALQSLVVPALPVLQQDLDTTPTGATWIFTSYLLSASVAMPIAGRLGDMYGKKRLLVISLAALALGCFVAAAGATLWMVILGRLMQGLGGGFLPLAFGIIRDEFPRERIPGAIGLMSGLLGVGAGLGIVLAGPIIEHLSYHWLFWIPGVVLLPAIILTLFVVPESPVRAPGRIDFVGAVLLSLWLVLLLVAISQAPTWGWVSARTVLSIIGAAVSAAFWVRVEFHATNPLVDMQMMAQRNVWAPNLAGFLLGASLFSGLVLISPFVQAPESTGYGFGASATQAGLFVLPSSILMLVSAPLAGRLARRFGAKLPLVLACAIAFTAFALLAVEHSSPWNIYVASLLMGAGFGFALASLGNLIVEAVRPDQTGVASGMNAVMRAIGAAVGSQIAASILAASVLASGYPDERGYTIAFAVLALALVVATAAALAVPGRRYLPAHIAVVEAGVSRG